MSFKMFRYLEKHYVGKYRVKAPCDESTLDFPRNENGGVDDEFDDQYIPCKRGEIRHTYRNTRGKDILCWFCESNTTANNVYKDIVEKYPDMWIEVDEGFEDYHNLIYFEASDIEKIASVVQPSTYGASIRPYSTKNLPKGLYTIPEKDFEKYKKIIGTLKMEKMELAAFVRTVNKDFSALQDSKVIKKKKDYVNFSLTQKRSRLKYKEYVHSMGLWEEYIDFIKKNAGDE